MDDYLEWESYVFYTSLVLLFLFSLYKISLELISSKEIGNFKGATKKFIEYLHSSKERVDLTLGQIIIILITIISFCAPYVMSDYVYQAIIPEYANVVILLSVVLVVTTIYYIVPLMAASFRVLILKLLSPLVRVLVWLLYPSTTIIYKFKTLAFNLEMGSSISNISMDELSDAVEIVSKASTPEDKRIITGMVRFANADVSDIMCHRTDMVAIEVNSSFKDAMEIVRASGFSRIPVYREVLDDIVGILYVKDLMPYIDNENFDWVSILRKPYFVSDTKMINEVLMKFQKKKNHIAIVVDEYGSTLGIVSMEDILEEIVGEIEDESDTEEQFYSKLDENNYIFEGKTAISDFLDVVGMDSDELDDIRGEAETLAGLIVELRQDMPKIGSRARVLDFNFTVVKMDNHRIDRVKISKISE